MLARAYSVKIGVIFRRPVWKTKSWYKCKPTWKLKHANSILETFEYFSWKSSKSITTILSYTVSKLVHLLRHSVDLHWPRANPRTAALLPVDIFSDRFVAVRFQAIGVCWRKRAGNNLTEQTISALQMWIQWWAVLVAAVVCRVQSLDVEEERVITQFQISSWSDEDCSVPVTRLLELRRLVRRYTDSLSRSGPLLVHCRFLTVESVVWCQIGLRRTCRLQFSSLTLNAASSDSLKKLARENLTQVHQLFAQQQLAGQSRCTFRVTCQIVAVFYCVQETCIRKKLVPDW